MWIRSAPLRRMRTLLRAQLPPRAFLKRDRGSAMFVTNAPVFDPTLTRIPGFTVEKRGALMYLSPDESWIMRFERRFAQPPDHFCRTLARFRGQAPGAQAMALFIRGAKLMDAGSSAEPAALEAFDRAVRQHAALALRENCGGGVYALALLNTLIHMPDPPSDP